MADLLFGPARVPPSVEERTTESGIQGVAGLGLGCMELEFVRGVKVSERNAVAIGQVAREKGVALSAHTPLFINFNAQEPAKISASQERLLNSAQTGKFNSYTEFTAILEQIEGKPGRATLNNMHVHASGIAFWEKSKIKHSNMKESDFNYVDLIKALKDCKVQGLLISESPNLEEDALLLQGIYDSCM